MDAGEVLRVVTSGLVGIVGTPANLVSLTYFFKHDRTTLGSRLLILLNSFDLVVCISAIGVNVFYFLPSNASNLKTFDITENIFKVLFKISIQCTGFTTCLLTITRSISLVKPFYQINQFRVATALLVHAIIISVMEILVLILRLTRSVPRDIFRKAWYIVLIVELVDLILIFLLVVISNIFSVASLRKSQSIAVNNHAIAKQATITVFILSTLFCSLNLALIVILLCLSIEVSIPPTVSWIAMWLALPLNSALNPLVYIWRKEPLRRYLMDEIKCCSGSRHVEKGHTLGHHSRSKTAQNHTVSYLESEN
ncbi:uncharacterized protein LOC134811677 [Bolinopsis microptera]|uniref:uncharacterized protein LOC134811677 n=1 Tax=Bolinopsis microptera TaxID=2820187 RepID=UPI0030794A6E